MLAFISLVRHPTTTDQSTSVLSINKNPCHSRFLQTLKKSKKSRKTTELTVIAAVYICWPSLDVSGYFSIRCLPLERTKHKAAGQQIAVWAGSVIVLSPLYSSVIHHYFGRVKNAPSV
jgi:hypothetical protein